MTDAWANKLYSAIEGAHRLLLRLEMNHMGGLYMPAYQRLAKKLPEAVDKVRDAIVTFDAVDLDTIVNVPLPEHLIADDETLADPVCEAGGCRCGDCVSYSKLPPPITGAGVCQKYGQYKLEKGFCDEGELRRNG